MEVSMERLNRYIDIDKTIKISMNRDTWEALLEAVDGDRHKLPKVNITIFPELANGCVYVSMEPPEKDRVVNILEVDVHTVPLDI